MKKIVSIIVALALCAGSMLFIVPSAVAAPSDDPAESYVPVQAVNEDPDISLWFEIPTNKVTKEDTTDSGRGSYTVYMAKNEIEDAQFVLSSVNDKTGLTATVTPFTDEAGNTVPAEIFIQYYIDTNGEHTPDPIPPLGTDTFDLAAGMSQAFYIKLTSTADTVAGWYSARLDIKNAAGGIVKTTTVYAKVWDFVISDDTQLASAVYLNSITLSNYHKNQGITSADVYKMYYKYLLENRVCAFNLPSDCFRTTGTEYLNNPRVTAFRVGAFGYNEQYSDRLMTAAYNKLVLNQDWLDKAYFYYEDEPLSYVDLQDLATEYTRVETLFPNHTMLVPTHENFPYVDKTGAFLTEDSSPLDAVGFLLDYIGISCVKPYAYTTPQTVATVPGARNINGTIKNRYLPSGTTYDWDTMFGTYESRLDAERTAGNDIKEWWYVCWEPEEPYSNIMIQNSGVSNKMLFWQMKQKDIEGFLYYYCNLWQSGAEWTDVQAYELEQLNADAFGDGILLYPGSVMGYECPVGSVRLEQIRDGIEEYQMLCMYETEYGYNAMQDFISTVSTSEVQAISDDAQFHAAKVALGNALEADHTWDAGTVTRAATCTADGSITYICTDAGCTAAMTAIIPATGHTLTSPVSTTAATCTLTGAENYVCRTCGENVTVVTRSLGHSYGNMTVVSEPTCTLDGTSERICARCANVETTVAPATGHTWDAGVITTAMACVTNEVKLFTCTVCGETREQVTTAPGHKYGTGVKISTQTCTTGDVTEFTCTVCGYSYTAENLPPLGHTWDAGVITTPATETTTGIKTYTCVTCGATKTEVIPVIVTVLKGDLTCDGKINALDILRFKLYLNGKVTLTEASLANADLTGDGKINALDMLRLKLYLNGKISTL